MLLSNINWAGGPRETAENPSRLQNDDIHNNTTAVMCGKIAGVLFFFFYTSQASRQAGRRGGNWIALLTFSSFFSCLLECQYDDRRDTSTSEIDTIT